MARNAGHEMPAERRTRLDAALAPLGIIDPKSAQCPNPDMVEVEFDLPCKSRGTMLAGAALFDFRKTYADTFAAHGFLVHTDAFGPGSISLSLTDVGIPEAAERLHRQRMEPTMRMRAIISAHRPEPVRA